MKTLVLGLCFSLLAVIPWVLIVGVFNIHPTLSMLVGGIIGFVVMNVTIGKMGFKEFKG